MHVQLTGQNGNIFNLIGLVTAALMEAGYREAAKKLPAEVTKCKSYDEAIQLLMSTVDVS